MSNEKDMSEMTKKERKDYLKTVKNSGNKSNQMKYLGVGAFVLVIVAAVAGLFFLSSNNGGRPSELGEKIAPPAAPNTALHIRKGEAQVGYTSNPPSSGPHYAGLTAAEGIGPIECKTYTQEVPDEGVIHNLEHGVVWVSYQDINDKDLASKLNNITKGYTKVVLSPRAKNDSKIAVVSWGRVLKLDTLEEQKVRDFIALYRSSADAPERLASCGTTHSGN